MATMAGKVRHIRDEAAGVVIRAPGGSAVAGAGTTYYPASTGLSLGTLETAYWDNSEIPWDSIGVQLVVTEIDTSSTDETYDFTVEVADGSAFSVPIGVATARVNAVGAYILTFDAKTAKVLDNGVDSVRLKLVAANTTPSINFYAWLVHIGH